MPTKTGDMTDKELAKKNADELCKLANQRFALQQENKRLRDALTMIVCESINAEYIAQNALDFVVPNVKVRGCAPDELEKE